MAGWGVGSRDADEAVALYGSGDWGGTGPGLALSGVGEGSGGPSDGIGFVGFGTLEHRCASCVDDSDGTGVATGGRLGHRHVVRPPPVRDAAPIVNGHVPPEVIQRVVRQNDGRYRFCYQNGLRANPNLAGRVTVKFVIDWHGQVAIATDGGSDLPDAGVRQCVISSFTSLSFPENDGGAVTVSYPLVFSPE